MIPIFPSKILMTLPSILGSCILNFQLKMCTKLPATTLSVKKLSWLQILLAIKSLLQLLVEASTLNFFPLELYWIIMTTKIYSFSEMIHMFSEYYYNKFMVKIQHSKGAWEDLIPNMLGSWDSSCKRSSLEKVLSVT